MSHFAVLVIGEDVDGALAPFNEETAVDGNAKWDWYVIGGRYAGRLVTKAGEVCDSARIGDLDLAAMLERRRAVYREVFYGDEFSGVQDGETVDEYVNRSARAISAFAVLKDGEWYEKGEMGWWGVVSNAKDDAEWQAKVEELVGALPPETRITVVDCHI